MLTSRRRFLQSTVGTSAVLSLGTTVPEFLARAAAQQAGDRSNERVLVVIQLSGGNDGLNTVIPVHDPAYKQARPTLAVSNSEALSLNDQLALHPSLRGLADLWEAQKLAIVQGVGYDKPNRSHFESMDIWHTCQRDKTQRQSGWLGRYLEAVDQQAGGDVVGLHLGGEQQPLALASRDLRVPSVESLDRFRLNAQSAAQEIEKLSAVQRKGGNELLGFVASSTQSALSASRRVAAAAKTSGGADLYPQTPLGQKMRMVGQLLEAGLHTRVFYVALDGFDTHSQQAPAHAGLLRQINDAVSAFWKDLERQQQTDRVMLMAFSEFGRRVKENASEGTDHGAAAPMLLVGEHVKAGLIGKQPSLTDLQDGDLKYHTDFRRVYAGVLEGWLKWTSADVLGAEYEPLAVV